MKVKPLLPLIVIISVALIAGITLILSKVLPEEKARELHPLSETSLNNTLRVVKTSSPGDDTVIYALNPIAEKAVYIALGDTKVKQILAGFKGKSLTISAIQPTVVADKNGRVTYSPISQIIITANWQYVNGNNYSNVESFSKLGSKKGESHQHIWNVFVDLNKHTVTTISEDPERVMADTFEPNLVFTGMNMFMPDKVKVNAGTTIYWSNYSNLPHNVVGTYKKKDTRVSIDSGFIQPNESWQYTFNDDGIFEYHCTIHTEDGMKGTVMVSSNQT